MNDFNLITQLLTHCNEALEGAAHPEVAREMLIGALSEGTSSAAPRDGRTMPRPARGHDRLPTEKGYRGPQSAGGPPKTAEGKAVRLRRLEKNWTQAELARRAKASKWQVHAVEYGLYVPEDARDRILAALGSQEVAEKPLRIATAAKRQSGPRPSRGTHRSSQQLRYQRNYTTKLKSDASFRSYVETLKSLRERVGMTAMALSTRIGMHPQYIQRMENFHTVPNEDMARQIANTLGVPVSTFPDISSVRVKKPMKRLPPIEPGKDLPPDANFHRPAHTDVI